MLGMATTILEAIALSQPATLLDGAEEERKIKIALGSRVTYAAQLIFNSFLQNMSGNCRYFGMDEGIVSGKRLQLIYLLDSGFKGYIFMAINDEAAMPDTALFEGISLKNCSLITPSWIPPIIDLFQRGKSGK